MIVFDRRRSSIIFFNYTSSESKNSTIKNAKIGSSNNVDTVVNLMKSKCLSVLLFNLEAVSLNRTDLNNLKFSIHRAYMKMFNIKDKISVDWCQFYMNKLPWDFILRARKLTFYGNM